MGSGVAIIGCGSSTSEIILDNQALSQMVDTSDEWITSRTGIKARRLSSQPNALTHLGAEAALKALEMAKVNPSEVDLILLATSTPDDLFGNAALIQAQIGATQAVAFDLTAACSGFLFAMVTASQYLRTGVYRNIVVIGGDILSRWVDWYDRGTCILFGDGAGAIVMQANDHSDDLLGFEMRSNGNQNEFLTLAYQGTNQDLLPGITVNQGGYQPIYMNGREVYRFALEKVPEVIEKALFKANLTSDRVDWLLLHQANQRILDGVAERLNIPAEKVISDIANHGNTSAASIPLALDRVVREGIIKSGDIIASAGFGAGLSWGAAIFRWQGSVDS